MLASIPRTTSRTGTASAAASLSVCTSNVLRGVRVGCCSRCKVDELGRALGDPVVANRGGDADDLRPRAVASVDANALAESALSGPVVIGEGRVHDGDVRGVRRVGGRERASRHDRDAHRGEVAFVNSRTLHGDAVTARLGIDNPRARRRRCLATSALSGISDVRPTETTPGSARSVPSGRERTHEPVRRRIERARDRGSPSRDDRCDSPVRSRPSVACLDTATARP